MNDFVRDVVFECVGNQTTLEDMESLYGGHIYPQIINCWSVLLNLDEDRKSREKPLRLFCNNDMMVCVIILKCFLYEDFSK